MKTSVIEVHDMLAVWSVDEVEKRISDVPGVASVTVNFAAGTATARYDETRLEIADIKSAVRQRGFEHPLTAAAPAGEVHEAHDAADVLPLTPAPAAPAAPDSAPAAPPAAGVTSAGTATQDTTAPKAPAVAPAAAPAAPPGGEHHHAMAPDKR